MARNPLITSESVKGDQAPIPSAKTISEILGVDPLLPGEPVADYQQGLQDLLVELGAKSTLQVYLAEKIYDCLWWIRRYEGQKRSMIIAEMAVQVAGVPQHMMCPTHKANQQYLRETLLQNKWDQKSLDILKAVGYSRQSLRQVAMTKRRDELQQLDQQIALQTKVLAGFQASYEVAFNRKQSVERLELQNALLRRDLEAIEGEVVGDKPQAKSRKSS